jgi:hypothetical protein
MMFQPAEVLVQLNLLAYNWIFVSQATAAVGELVLLTEPDDCLAVRLKVTGSLRVPGVIFVQLLFKVTYCLSGVFRAHFRAVGAWNVHIVLHHEATSTEEVIYELSSKLTIDAN